MATAKLWWNGSSWVASEANAMSKTSYSNNSAGIKGIVRLVAYDDGTLKLYAQLRPDGQSGEGNNISGTLVVSYGGTSISVTNSSARAASDNDVRYAWSGAITATTGTITTDTGAQQISGTYYRNGAKYYQKLSWNTSNVVNISPFITISYNANGGTGAPESATICRGAITTLSSTIPTRTGYNFLGWSTSDTATTASYTAGESVTLNSDTILYAVWKLKTYIVTINAGEGTTIVFDGAAYSNVNTTVNKDYQKVCSVSIAANSGFLLKSRDPIQDGTITIPANNNTVISAIAQRVGCHLDNGVEWVQGMIYYDNGIEWIMCQAYYDDGTQWHLVY